MRNKAISFVMIGLALILSSCGLGDKVKQAAGLIFDLDDEKKPQLYRLSMQNYEDKVRGAWAGKMIGLSFASPYELVNKGEILDFPLKSWNPVLVESSLKKSELYVALTFLHIIDRKGLVVTSNEAGSIFARTSYPLSGANETVRKNLRAGIRPPDSGHPRYNPYANRLDFQSQADVFGLICPGLPLTALRYTRTFGEMMAYGDGMYGGYYLTGLYSTAFFEEDRVKVIEQGLNCIPPSSNYAQVIQDVLQFYSQKPEDWRLCWEMLESKWGQTDVDPEGFEQPLNLDAKLNGGYITLALLYGEGDFSKTIEIIIRCGQDSDTNAATTLGILGAIAGYNRIPTEYRVGIPLISSTDFAYVNYNYNTLIATCRKWAAEVVERRGGEVQWLGDRQYFSIPRQTPEPLDEFAQFDLNMAENLRDEWENLETIRLTSLQQKLNQDIQSFAQGWTVEHCGLKTYVGNVDEYYGRFKVFATHPLNQDTPCKLVWNGTLPGDVTKFKFVVAPSDGSPNADWSLRVSVNGEEKLSKTIDQVGGNLQWHNIEIDVSDMAGTQTTITLENAALGWDYETAYWGRFEITP